MPQKTIVNGSLYIFNATEEQFNNGTASISSTTITYPDKLVEIHSTTIDYDYTNDLKLLPNIQSKKIRGEIPPETRIIDLKRINEIISVRGALEDEESESATTKKNNLLAMGKHFGLSSEIGKFGELTIVWGTGNYQTVWRPNSSQREHGVFISKMKFIETAGIYGDNVTADPQPERKIDIQIQLIKGKDI